MYVGILYIYTYICLCMCMCVYGGGSKAMLIADLLCTITVRGNNYFEMLPLPLT